MFHISVLIMLLIRRLNILKKSSKEARVSRYLAGPIFINHLNKLRKLSIYKNVYIIRCALYLKYIRCLCIDMCLRIFAGARVRFFDTHVSHLGIEGNEPVQLGQRDSYCELLNLLYGKSVMIYGNGILDIIRPMIHERIYYDRVSM